MTDAQRDELLFRMDERQESMSRAVCKIEEEVDGLTAFKVKTEATIKTANVFSTVVAFFIATTISALGLLLGR